MYYGSAVYGSANDTLLKPLYILYNDALRMAVGAFPSSPIETLMNITGEQDFIQRRDTLICRYYYKIIVNLSSSVFNSVVRLDNNRLFNNMNIKPLSLRIDMIMSKYSIKKANVKP